MPLFRRSTRLCFDIYILYVHQVHVMHGKIDWNHGQINWNHENSMKTMENRWRLWVNQWTVEKASKTMETSMNSANGNCLLQISAKYRTGFCSKMQIARKSAPDWKTKQNKNNSPKKSASICIHIYIIYKYKYIYIIYIIYIYLFIYNNRTVTCIPIAFRAACVTALVIFSRHGSSSGSHGTGNIREIFRTYIFSPSGFRLKRGEIVPRRFLQLRIF